MKFYLYISDTKVDMLLPQIPQDVKRDIATEFKVDLKLFSASRKSEIRNSEDRISRLEAVCDFIRQYGDVGDVDQPGEYVQDVLEMRMLTERLYDPPMVFFCSRTSQTLVGIGGSAQHLIGYVGQDDPPERTPSPPDLIPLLMQVLERLPWPEAAEMADVDPEWGLSRIKGFLNTRPPGIVQRYEFLAKRMLWEQPKQSRYDHDYEHDLGAHSRKILLASPLYVAMAD